MRVVTAALDQAMAATLLSAVMNASSGARGGDGGQEGAEGRGEERGGEKREEGREGEERHEAGGRASGDHRRSRERAGHKAAGSRRGSADGKKVKMVCDGEVCQMVTDDSESDGSETKWKQMKVVYDERGVGKAVTDDEGARSSAAEMRDGSHAEDGSALGRGWGDRLKHGVGGSGPEGPSSGSGIGGAGSNPGGGGEEKGGVGEGAPGPSAPAASSEREGGGVRAETKDIKWEAAPRAVLVVKLPDGGSVTGEFDAESPLREAVEWIEKHRSGGGGRFALERIYPREAFDSSHLEFSLVRVTMMPSALFSLSFPCLRPVFRLSFSLSLHLSVTSLNLSYELLLSARDVASKNRRAANPPDRTLHFLAGVPRPFRAQPPPHDPLHRRAIRLRCHCAGRLSQAVPRGAGSVRPRRPRHTLSGVVPRGGAGVPGPLRVARVGAGLGRHHSGPRQVRRGEKGSETGRRRRNDVAGDGCGWRRYGGQAARR